MKRSTLKYASLVVTSLLALSLAPAQAATWAMEDPGVTGVKEITFAGSGSTNTQFSDSFGGATASIGVYFNEEWQAILRQSIDYSNPENGSRRYNGSTKVALDYNFSQFGSAMPFIGVNLGRIYGTDFRDSWSGGLEAGVKYYVVRKLFVFVMADYSWLFQRTREIDDKFDDGQLTWSAGIGFNF